MICFFPEPSVYLKSKFNIFSF